MTLSDLDSKAASLTVASSNGTCAAEPFGKAMLKHFLFAKGWRNLNHGSFGAYPDAVRSALRHFQDIAEAQPDVFQRYDQVEYLNQARAEVAALVKAPLSTVVLVQNVTTGVNTMLRNLVYAPGDVIMHFSTTYGACQKTVASTAEVTLATSHNIHLPYPMSDDKLVALFYDTVADLRSKGKRPRVAVIDTIISLPGVRMPFERLVAACRELGIFSVMDAAHCVGHIAIDLPKLDPDFFVSNCHKWLFAPRGCAVMYVPIRNQELVRTSFPTSHYFVPNPALAEDGDDEVAWNPLGPLSGDDTRFTKLFEFVGTLDISPYLALPAALKFRREVCGGEERLMKYCADLAYQGSSLVAKALGTEILDNDEGTMTKDCAMVNVRLPLVAPGSSYDNGSSAVAVKLDDRGVDRVIRFIHRLLIDEFNCFISTCFFEGAWWARLSGQVYLELSDFEFASEVLKNACERVRAGEHLEPAKT